MKQQTIIITGANRGIGRGIARALAGGENHIIMACRDTGRAHDSLLMIKEESKNDNIELLELDLSSFRSVRAFAESIKRKNIGITTLINNAGTLNTRYQLTEDNYEMTTEVNYLSQFLLTMLLLPVIKKHEGKIINTSSIMYRAGKINDDFLTCNENTYNGFRAYANSKLAFLLFSIKLAEKIRQDGIRVYSADPGIVNTNMLTMHRWFDPLTDILFRPFVKSEENGAETSIYLAGEHTPEPETGTYFIRKKERKLSAKITKHPHMDTLWDRTMNIIRNNLTCSKIENQL